MSVQMVESVGNVKDSVLLVLLVQYDMAQGQKPFS